MRDTAANWLVQKHQQSSCELADASRPRSRGGTYYLCGNTWFKPSYGANGVYYRVVPAP